MTLLAWKLGLQTALSKGELRSKSVNSSNTLRGVVGARVGRNSAVLDSGRYRNMAYVFHRGVC